MLISGSGKEALPNSDLLGHPRARCTPSSRAPAAARAQDGACCPRGHIAASDARRAVVIDDAEPQPPISLSV